MRFRKKLLHAFGLFDVCPHGEPLHGLQSRKIYRVCQKMTQLLFVRTLSNLHQI